MEHYRDWQVWCWSHYSAGEPFVVRETFRFDEKRMNLMAEHPSSCLMVVGFRVVVSHTSNVCQICFVISRNVDRS